MDNICRINKKTRMIKILSETEFHKLYKVSSNSTTLLIQ